MEKVYLSQSLVFDTESSSMSNNTDVDDSPKDASDTADEERPERQGDQSPLEEDGDRRPDVDDPIDEFESSSDEEEERRDRETVDDLGSTVEVDPGVEVDEEIAEDDLLGGLKIDSTEDIEVPDRLVDQVIGQDEARDIIIKAAKQRRHVMMIGSPGTGKSMLAKAMSQLLPQEDLQDVLVYPNPDDDNEPKVRTVPAGKGSRSSTLTEKRRTSTTGGARS